MCWPVFIRIFVFFAQLLNILHLMLGPYADSYALCREVLLNVKACLLVSIWHLKVEADSSKICNKVSIQVYPVKEPMNFFFVLWLFFPALYCFDFFVVLLVLRFTSQVCFTGS